MKNYILDTHTLLWMQDDNPLLSKNVQNILKNQNNILHVSIVSFWEITIKQSLRKLELDYTLDDLIIACKLINVTIIPIQIDYLNILKDLPLNHRDPFDRLIIATSMFFGYPLISKDNQIKNYNLEVIW